MDNTLTAFDGLVGSTPLIKICLRYDGRVIPIFAKAEFMNLTGSIKDRMALHILKDAYQRNQIKPGDVIVEGSSGNTAISFAVLGRALGHPVRIYMPDWLSRERFELLRLHGSEVVPVSKEEGGFEGAIGRAAKDALRPAFFGPRQFANPANVDAHRLTTGPEICTQLAEMKLKPDAFVAGVGTGGTVMGVAAHFAEAAPGARCHPLEPANSPILTTGEGGKGHRIQGIGDEFVPDIVDLDALAEPVSIWDGDAILMARKLALAGLPVGISSGANVLGAVKIALDMGPDAVVTTILPDCNKKYLSTDLVREEPVREEYMSRRLEVQEYAADLC